MSHSSVTPDLKSDMPRQQGLLRRGARYYTNFKVPKDLIAAFGKAKICEALGTSDYREACRRVVSERMRYELAFEAERAKISRHEPIRTETVRLTTLSKADAFKMACGYLISREGEMREWMWREGRFLREDQRAEIVDTLGMDASAYVGYNVDRGPDDGTDDLKRYLESQGIECAESSPAFRALRPLIFDAHLEYLQRSESIVSGKVVSAENLIFRNVHYHSQVAEPAKGYTVDDLIKKRDKAVSGGSLKSRIAAHPAARLMREVLGKNTLLSSITPEDIERLFDVMENIPVNAGQRYRGMTYAKAIKEAAKRGDTRKPHVNTNWATYTQIHAIFNYGVDAKLCSQNPVSGRIYRKRFRKERSCPRAQFTTEELNRLFRAPLYTGCVNDGNAYLSPGPNKPRRGRFWVPLLCLFHGMRNNEACQFYTEDVKEENGIHYLAIREGLDHTKKSEKKLKTPQSARNVPIHPELIRLGFLDFVETRRADKKAPRLFPDLEGGRNGYFSDAFSKWFSRFVKETLSGCKATLHSFRHQFRDATRAARISNEVVGRLAGWEYGQKESGLMMHQYGGGPVVMKLLAEDIAKVCYPGLDLSHLYPKPLSSGGVLRSAIGRVRDD